MPLHAYSYGIEDDERIRVIYKLAIYSGVLGLVLFFVAKDPLRAALQKWEIDAGVADFILSVPSTLAFFLFLYKNLEHHMWKWKPVRWVLGITVPNLTGCWGGKARLYGPSGEFTESSPVYVSIRQRWRRIAIALNGPRHKSDSQGASVHLCADGFVVRYSYFAVMKYAFSKEIDITDGRSSSHVGFARLYAKMVEGEVILDSLKIQFFTDDLRRGSIRLKKMDCDKVVANMRNEVREINPENLSLVVGELLRPHCSVASTSCDEKKDSDADQASGKEGRDDDEDDDGRKKRKKGKR